MYLDALLMYDCLYIFVMSFTSVFLFLNNLDFIINVYVFVFVICLIWPYVYWSLLYECLCDPLVVLLVLYVQALIKNSNKKSEKYFFCIPIFFK